MSNEYPLPERLLAPYADPENDGWRLDGADDGRKVAVAVNREAAQRLCDLWNSRARRQPPDIDPFPGAQEVGYRG